MPEDRRSDPADGFPMTMIAPDEEENDSNLSLEEDENGGAVLKILEDAKGPDSATFEENLANKLSDEEIARLTNELLEGIDSDIDSRSDWESAYNRGLDLLGLKIEEATTNVNPQGTISRVYHPLLLEAVITFQANAFPELCPTAGPVKVRDDAPPPPDSPPPVPPSQPMPPGMGAPAPGMPAQGAMPPPPPPNPQMGHNGGPPMLSRDDLANALEKDMNHYLTAVAKEYYPDYNKMLFQLALGGCAFRKIYQCPVRRRPVSEHVAAPDLIVSNGTVALTDCGRKTHRIKMRNASVKRMMASGQWIDTQLVQPMDDLTPTEQKLKEIEGIAPSPDLPADFQHTIYECYAELTIKGDTLCKAKYPVPYRVTLDKDSRKILEIRRNWKKNDEHYRERRRFVKFSLVQGIGFYDLGYVHILGNTSRALTAILRQLLDAGQFCNFPGLLIPPQTQRQTTNQIRVPPGGAQEIDTGGVPINQAVMAMPYKEPSQVLAMLAEKMAMDARKLGAAVEIPVGEGAADIPVGTVIALMEQATKVIASTHKLLHISQQEEFEIFRELFIEDPTALSRFSKRPARQWEQAEELTDLELVPASDPNTPSHMHRLMKTNALVTMAQAAPPGLFNARAVAERALKEMGIQDINEILPPPPPVPPPPPPNPQMEMAKVAQQDVQQRGQKTQAEMTLRSQKQQQDHALKQNQLQVKAMQDAANIQIKQKQLEQDATQKNLTRDSQERIAKIRGLTEAMKMKFQERIAAKNNSSQGGVDNT